MVGAGVKRHVDVIPLPKVADIRRVGIADVARVHSAGETVTTLGKHLAGNQLEDLARHLRKQGAPRSHRIIGHRGDDHAKGRRHARTGRDQHGSDAQAGREVARMDGAGAAKRDQRAGPGVFSVLADIGLRRRRHVLIDDRMNAKCRLIDRNIQRSGKPCIDCRAGRAGIELHAAAQEVIGVQIPQHEICVGHRRFGPALRVAGRTRDR